MVEDRIEDRVMMSDTSLHQIDRLLPDERMLRDIAGFYSVFSDSMRVKIVSALAISEMCVSDLARLLDSYQSTISHQLQVLRRYDIVDYRREGKLIIYYVRNVLVEDVMSIGIENIKNMLSHK